MLTIAKARMTAIPASQSHGAWLVQPIPTARSGEPRYSLPPFLPPNGATEQNPRDVRGQIGARNDHRLASFWPSHRQGASQLRGSSARSNPPGTGGAPFSGTGRTVKGSSVTTRSVLSLPASFTKPVGVPWDIRARLVPTVGVHAPALEDGIHGSYRRFRALAETSVTRRFSSSAAHRADRLMSALSGPNVGAVRASHPGLKSLGCAPSDRPVVPRTMVRAHPQYVLNPCTHVGSLRSGWCLSYHSRGVHRAAPHRPDRHRPRHRPGRSCRVPPALAPRAGCRVPPPRPAWP